MIVLALHVVAIVLVIATMPGTIELLLLTLANLLPSGDPSKTSAPATSIKQLAIVIPAHDEALVIARCVRSIASCTAPAAVKTSIVVIADNCIDETAELARAAGARVMARSDEAHRGKGFALRYAFARLLDEGVDAVMVVDADTVVERDALLEIVRVLQSGADGVQVRYTVLNPAASMRARLMNVAFMAFNVLRPRGRERLRLSVGILGNGFALSRATLIAVPYQADSIVEDLEYHLRLVHAGRRVHFVDRTTVRAAMPAGGAGVRTQRARWEGGRLRMITQDAPRLAREVAAGRWRLLEPLLELLLLPLAFHVSMLLIVLGISGSLTRLYAMAALAAVVLHVGAGIVFGGGESRDFIALAVAPFYVLWKLAAAPATLRSARRDTPWIRTARQ